MNTSESHISAHTSPSVNTPATPASHTANASSRVCPTEATLDTMARGWCPGLSRPMASGDGLLARVHPPHGSLTPEQALALAEAAHREGNGLIDITTHANLQIRGVKPSTHTALRARLAPLGLDDAGRRAPYRATVLSPLAGLDGAEQMDGLALADRVETMAHAVALPPKFLIAVDSGGSFPLNHLNPDLRLAATAPGYLQLFLAGSPTLCTAPLLVEQALAALPHLLEKLAHTLAQSGVRRVRMLTGNARRATLVQAGLMEAGLPDMKEADAQENDGVRPAVQQLFHAGTTNATGTSTGTLAADVLSGNAHPHPEQAGPPMPPVSTTDAMQTGTGTPGEIHAGFERPTSARHIAAEAARLHPGQARTATAAIASSDAQVGDSTVRPMQPHPEQASTPTLSGPAASTKQDLRDEHDSGRIEASGISLHAPAIRSSFHAIEDDVLADIASGPKPPAGLAHPGAEQPFLQTTQRPRPSAPRAGTVRLKAGTYALFAAPPFGQMSARALEGVARLAQDLGLAEIRLSPLRGIVLTGLAPAMLAEARTRLDTLGLIIRADDSRLRILTCAGAPACSRALCNSHSLASQLAAHLRPATGAEDIHLSACLKGCARRGPAPLTLVAQAGGFAVIPDGGPLDTPVLVLSFPEILHRLSTLPAGRALREAFVKDHSAR